MRTAVESHNIYRWAGKVLQALDGVMPAAEPEPVLAARKRVKIGAA